MKKLIKAKNTEFEQNARTLAIIDTRQRGGKPIMIDADVLDEAIANGELDALESIKVDDGSNLSTEAVMRGMDSLYAFISKRTFSENDYTEKNIEKVDTLINILGGVE